MEKIGTFLNNFEIANMIGKYDSESKRFTFKNELYNELTHSLSKRHHEEQLQFHSDWNWLMEAIDHIEKEFKVLFKISTHWVTIDSTSESKFDFKTISIPHTQFDDDPSKKDAVFKSVYLFAIRFNNHYSKKI